MTCEKCYHNEVCEALYKMNGIPRIGASQCAYFRDKSRFVELPCKVGDTVYYIPFGNKIEEYVVARIAIEPLAEVGMSFHCYGGIAFDKRDIGKTVFLSHEEAEQALAERSGK